MMQTAVIVKIDPVVIVEVKQVTECGRIVDPMWYGSLSSTSSGIR